MFEYKTYESPDDAVLDMDKKSGEGFVVVTAWFNSIDKMIYVTYRTRDEDQ